MGWTEQQKNAIEARNSSIMVSAAAGSGKTAVLTERLAQLISDESSGVRADRIIAVTFTKDAAAELRKRLDKKLREMLADNPGSRHLLRQQTLLQSAKISTINSFCFDLLRDNITDQGITSGFAVLDDADDSIIKKKSLDELINLYCSENHDSISFIYDKFCIKDDKNLTDVIAYLDSFLSSEAFRDKWLDKAEKNFSAEPYESVYFEKLRVNTIDNLKRAVKLAKECCKMLDDIFIECRESKPAKDSYNQTYSELETAERALKIFEDELIPDAARTSELTEFENLVTVRKTSGANIALREIYIVKRKEYINLIKSAVNAYNGFESEYLECRQVTEIICGMLRKYREIVWSKKCEKNALSFDDGERLVLELLADFDENGCLIQSGVARRLSEYYDIIMIDEYQDSNNKQDMIFKLLSKDFGYNGKNHPVYGSNAFIVGDVKQAIYRFRLANPKNFINTLDGAEPYSPNSNAMNQAIMLNKNFRSSQGVIDYVNYIFTLLMSKKCGDVRYDKNEMLYFGASEYEGKLPEASVRTQITLIHDDKNIESEDDEDSEVFISGVNSEAVYVAEKIRKMIEEKAEVVLKDGKPRPCEPSDFCILTRKKRFSKDYVNELKKRGIEVRGEEEKGYLKSKEIAILIDLLRIIDNPLLDVPLAAVMLSPMYMFELEEIAFLKSLDRNAHIYTIVNDISEHKYDEYTDYFFIERCSSFIKALSDFRLLAVTMTVSELITAIYDKTDFVYVMQMLADGDKKRANLRALVQYAKNYEEAASMEGSGGLTGFVRYIDRIFENGDDFNQGKISTSTGNYVSVKTIHKSKGLEFPFVFLAETSTRFRFDSSSVVCTDDGRIGYVLYNPKLVRKYKTGAYKQIKKENKRDTISEEMRLFYVALSRAKQQLFINLKYGQKQIESLKKLIENYLAEGENPQKAAESANSISDWVWVTLLGHEKFRGISEKIDILNESEWRPEVKYSDKLFDIVYADDDVVSCSEELQETEKAAINMQIYNQLKEIMNFRYDMTLSEVPSKLSVTQIAKKLGKDDEHFDFSLRRPLFAEENSRLTGAEIGTAIHTFFQYCDFEKARTDLEAEILRITQSGYLSETQAKSVNRENSAAFFESELFKRIEKADSIQREKKFMAAVSELEIDGELAENLKNSDGMIKGIVDLIFEESGKLILMDYKSDRGATAAKLRERYTKQLKLYKSAMELTTGKKVAEAYLYSFELRQSIKVDI